MGLSLAVVVALVFILPGAAFVFALNRDVSQAKQSPLDAQVSETLALAVVAALLLNACWYWLWQLLCHWSSLPTPDAVGFFSLIRSETKDVVADNAIRSVAAYPVRISSYFCSLAFLGHLFGMVVRSILSHFRENDEGALWGTLLSPPNVDLIWMTVDVELDGDAFLFAGSLRDYAVNRDGGLERIVLLGAVRKPLSAVVQVAQTAPSAMQSALPGDWRSVPGEFVVLNVASTKTINIDYFYQDDPGEHSDTGDDGTSTEGSPSSESGPERRVGDDGNE
ncbi:hypothetical protein [Luteibacter sp.]|uniref:hypothetical protein n=1 Tax=Luteibacter sp. TaxID=1886636 RepID=UPI003F809F33